MPYQSSITNYENRVSFQSDVYEFLASLELLIDEQKSMGMESSGALIQHFEELKDEVTAMRIDGGQGRKMSETQFEALNFQLYSLSRSLDDLLSQSQSDREANGKLTPSLMHINADLARLQALLAAMTQRSVEEPTIKMFDLKITLSDFLGVIVLIVTFVGVFVTGVGAVIALNQWFRSLKFKEMINERVSVAVTEVHISAYTITLESLEYSKAYGAGTRAIIWAHQGWNLNPELLLMPGREHQYLLPRHLGDASNIIACRRAVELCAESLNRWEEISCIANLISNSKGSGLGDVTDQEKMSDVVKNELKEKINDFEKTARESYKAILNNYLFYCSIFPSENKDFPDVKCRTVPILDDLTKLEVFVREKPTFQRIITLARYSIRFSEKEFGSTQHSYEWDRLKALASEMISMAHSNCPRVNHQNVRWQINVALIQGLRSEYTKKFGQRI
ncbi:hypothetical protein [Cerasicoccus arenae]|uniref:Uncharacterized protein n=2 Tax=Cerasicoccus arenae TaxID=424488 RepID=A0A8J3D9D3_9BACT|nr:hypothetical protein GCM10007047_12790 [Cerasicoccus arenae]